jgi:hypothetical protein
MLFLLYNPTATLGFLDTISAKNPFSRYHFRDEFKLERMTSNTTIELLETAAKYALVPTCMSKCNLTAWDCGAYCSSYTKGTVLHSTFLHQNGIEGFVAHNPRTRKIVVSFRATNELKDWTNTNLRFSRVRLDSFFKPVPAESLVSDKQSIGADVLVHRGFVEAYFSVRLHVMNALSSLVETYPDYDILSTGYSLGAGKKEATYY